MKKILFLFFCLAVNSICIGQHLTIQIDTVFAMPYDVTRYYIGLRLTNTTKDTIFIIKKPFFKSDFTTVGQNTEPNTLKLNHLDTTYDLLLDTRLIYYEYVPPVLATDSAFLYQRFDSTALQSNDGLKQVDKNKNAVYSIAPTGNISLTVPIVFMYEEAMLMRKLTPAQWERLQMEIIYSVQFYTQASEELQTALVATGESALLKRVIAGNWYSRSEE